MQHYVYQMTFRKMFWIEEETSEVRIGLEQNIIDAAVNE